MIKTQSKIIRIFLYSLFFIITLFSCSEKSKQTELKTGSVFFSDTANKLWRHKVNSIEDLHNYSTLFKGIELDIVYYPDKNVFEVEHDPNPNKSIMLDDYLDSIANTEELHYWLDLKNLKWEYVDELMERLEFVLNKHNIKSRVIIESWSLKSLKKLNKKGFYTSYWIPNFNYNGEITSKQQEVLNKIKNNLTDCKHNAISAPYQMLPFIKDHLSDCTVHLWTNGLKTENDKLLIKDIAATSCVKVVLVDYEKPF